MCVCVCLCVCLCVCRWVGGCGGVAMVVNCGSIFHCAMVEGVFRPWGGCRPISISDMEVGEVMTHRRYGRAPQKLRGGGGGQNGRCIAEKE